MPYCLKIDTIDLITDFSSIINYMHLITRKKMDENCFFDHYYQLIYQNYLFRANQTPPPGQNKSGQGVIRSLLKTILN